VRKRQRSEFWRSLPPSSRGLFLAAVFFTFSPFSFLLDAVDLGRNPPLRLVLLVLVYGAISVGYAAAASRPKVFYPIIIAAHLLVMAQFSRFAPARTPVNQAALQTRLMVDAGATIASVIVAYVLFATFIGRQGVRYVRDRTEIVLARDIHRLLVPGISRRAGRFEFCGISVPSGDVGGDLVDLVESDGRWIGYVADVSGHGVASGLLMGMVKSAARMKLRSAQSIGALMDELNVVLLDLKKPEMFVTFACVQYDGSPELQFSLAGHLPILHRRSADAAIDELSLPQVPLAMFGDRQFTAARVAFAPGDLFVIVTDGLTEVFDGDDREFGLDGLKAIVQQHGTAPLESLRDEILSAAHGHGAQLDDQTLLLIRAVA